MFSVPSLFFFIGVFSLRPATALANMKVLVTGAGGKTGRIVMQKLLERPAFTPTGVVRTQASKEKLVQEGIPEDTLVVADICNAESMTEACQGMNAIIVASSATPAPTGEMTAEGRPVFGFPNGHPEQVDWIGQKNQIDAGKQAGSVSQIVICSSMGGTDPDNSLNKLGLSEDGTGGNILLWKRKAEKYLIDSGISYTIIHPGGLLDQAGGVRELVVGINDQSQLTTDNRSIPRADVAELLIASLEHESYKNRSFDASSKPEGEGTVTKDFDALLKDLKGSCDYSLGVIPGDDTNTEL